MNEYSPKPNIFLVLFAFLFVIGSIYTIFNYFIPHLTSFIRDVDNAYLLVKYDMDIMIIPSAFVGTIGIALLWVHITFRLEKRSMKLYYIGMILIFIALVLFMLFRSLGPSGVKAWLDGKGYVACGELSDFEYNLYNYKAFVRHENLCLKGISLSGETEISLREKIASNQLDLDDIQKTQILDALNDIE